MARRLSSSDSLPGQAARDRRPMNRTQDVPAAFGRGGLRRHTPAERAEGGAPTMASPPADSPTLEAPTPPPPSLPLPPSSPTVGDRPAARNHPPSALKWPKVVPPLTAEQQRISNDFMRCWHRLLPRHYSVVERFNHGYPVRHAPRNFKTTLEIGAGLGEHLAHEPLTPEQARNYHMLELRENMTRALRARFPHVRAVTGDCQRRLEEFPDGYFDRVLAIHVLEHLPDLPAAVRECHRLCNKRAGVFSVVIPCEGSPAYSLARRVSAQRLFERRYKQPYDWFITREHI